MCYSSIVDRLSMYFEALSDIYERREDIMAKGSPEQKAARRCEIMSACLSLYFNSPIGKLKRLLRKRQL